MYFIASVKMFGMGRRTPRPLKTPFVSSAAFCPPDMILKVLLY